MRDRSVLVTGALLLAVSLIGPTVQASVDNSTASRGWTSHMSGRGHMWGGWGDADAGSIDSAVEGAEEMVVVATDFGFAPSELAFIAGEPMNLRLVNQGRLPHDLVIPELDWRISADPGGQAVAGLDPEPGVYRFWCSYPGHASQGMSGTLTVEPSS